MEFIRTHYCNDVTQIGENVTVCGWVAKRRNLGNLLFIDLRDRSGIVQLAFDDKTPEEVFSLANSVRGEYVVAAKGIVRKRESVNNDIPTGQVEIFVSDFIVYAKAKTPPFEIVDDINVKEELRLKYRYLDLRRSEMQRNLYVRHKIAKAARDYYDQQGFMEIETPILIGSTPEGARDYLVPSRVHPGEFYVLPQSPQLYKQLLMLSGYDRYFQIAKCFRDEDLRADRQPEFTQIDLEMSFVNQQQVIEVNEGFLKKVFKEVLDKDIQTPFIQMPYSEAMERFGSDKPDTRFGMELCDLTALVKNTEFKVFAGAVNAGGSVRAINAKGLADKLSRKEIDKLVEFVKTYRAKGLAYTRLTADAESSSYEKFLSEEEKQAIRKAVNAEKGDVILIVADGNNNVVYDSLGQLRVEIAKKFDLIDPDAFNFLWVTDFPLFEYDEEEGRYMAKHHPFTAPKDEDIEILETDPAHVRAKAYDIVLNGCEVGGGSIRINDSALQARMFKALGFTPERAKEQFGFLMEAFEYGVPPHGGMAYGLDRLVMLILKKDSIRDVIAFPKVQNASELMTNCPSPVDAKQLAELNIALTKEQ